MIEGAKMMKCGGCGCADMRVYRVPDEGGFGFYLAVECQKCKSVTTIKPTQPTLALGWTEGSSGRLAVFSKDTDA